MAKKKSKNNFEVSNETVFIVLLLAMTVSIGGTFTVLFKLSSIGEASVPITGRASDGYTRINIESTASIDVDPNNDTIDFGTCVPPASPLVANISSEMTLDELNNSNSGIMNCSNVTGFNLPAKIRIQNTGNVDVALDVYSDSTGSGMLTSTEAILAFTSKDSDYQPGCTGSVNADQVISGTGAGNTYTVCDTLTFGASTNAVDFYVNLTIPYDASTGGTASESVATLTFQGS